MKCGSVELRVGGQCSSSLKTYGGASIQGVLLRRAQITSRCWDVSSVESISGRGQQFSDWQWSTLVVCEDPENAAPLTDALKMFYEIT